MLASLRRWIHRCTTRPRPVLLRQRVSVAVAVDDESSSWPSVATLTSAAIGANKPSWSTIRPATRKEIQKKWKKNKKKIDVIIILILDTEAWPALYRTPYSRSRLFSPNVGSHSSAAIDCEPKGPSPYTTSLSPSHPLQSHSKAFPISVFFFFFSRLYRQVSLHDYVIHFSLPVDYIYINRSI